MINSGLNPLLSDSTESILNRSRRRQSKKHRKDKATEFSSKEERNTIIPAVNAGSSKPEYTGESAVNPSFSRSQLSNQSELDDDLDFFNNAIEITNIDKINQVALVKMMHTRFKRKSVKWERETTRYSRWCFMLNFSIMLMQLLQILFDQLIDISGMADIVKNQTQLKAGRCVLIAFTGMVAVLQMKMKLIEKSEKYRRGAKVYGRLRRISKYYLMLAETGGKIEDVTGLWREAMAREGKGIPTVKSYLSL